MKRIIALITLTSALLKAEISFQQHDVATGFNQVMTVDVCDVDKDGDNDIVGGSFGSGEVSWWENGGSQNFLIKHPVAAGSKSVRHMRAADLDSDNQPDLVITQVDSSKVTLFYSINQSTPIKIILDTQLIGAHTIDIIDFDNDSNLDILVSGSNMTGVGKGEIVWFKNEGGRNFSRKTLWQQYTQVTFVQAVNLNSDNKYDLLTCDEKIGRVAWLKNSGDNLNFTEQIVDTAFSKAHTVLARDVDKDGDLDILGAACVSSQIAWWENNRSTEFTKHQLPQAAGALWLDQGDFDLDGDNDLVVGGSAMEQPCWLKNDGNFNFSVKIVGTAAAFLGAFQIIPVDLDKDGDIDLLGAGKRCHKITWWENNALTGIEKPVKAKDQGMLNNYPNPFNPQTSINFTTVQQERINLDVYNSSGALVSSLCNSELIAGNHTFNFNGSDLESGIYFCKLTAGKNTYCKKIALVK